jgi:hypothetical protein
MAATYFLRAGETDKIKIGWSEDPEARRTELQTAHWEALQFIRLIEGPQSVERWLHRQFAERRIHLEWFTFDDRMLTIEPPSLVLTGQQDAETLRIIEALGGATVIAEALGINRNAVVQWYKNGIAARAWRELVMLSEQRGAGITLADLNDSWWASHPRSSRNTEAA